MIAMRNAAKILFPAVLTVAACYFSGCSSKQVGNAVVQAGEQGLVVRPLLVGVVVDESISTKRNLVSKPTRGELEELLAIVRQTGGELGVTTIREHAQPILRVQLETEAIGDSTAKNVLKKSQERARLRKKIGEIEQVNAQRISEFLTRVQPILDRPNDAALSSVWGALGVADTMLAEDHQAWGVEPRRILLAATDGDDDVTRRPLALRSGAELLVVNQTGVTGDLDVLKPVTFGSIRAATRHIRALITE
jgi:hypothetical protein